MNRSLTNLLLAAALLLPVTAFGQTSHTIAVYGIGSQITGTAGVGELETDVAVDVDTIFDNLEMAGMARYRAEAPRWSFVLDGVFLGLGAGKDGTAMDLDLTIFEADAGYRFNDTVEMFLGVRYTDLSAAVRTTGPADGELFIENGDEFVDPVIGVRLMTPLSQKWLLQGQADIGGFGVGMDFQWQAMLDVGYRVGDSWAFLFGYRALGQDFKDAGDNGRFNMDVTYHGPQAAVAYRFQ
jgi:hypothetical protein